MSALTTIESDGREVAATRYLVAKDRAWAVGVDACAFLACYRRAVAGAGLTLGDGADYATLGDIAEWLAGSMERKAAEGTAVAAPVVTLAAAEPVVNAVERTTTLTATLADAGWHSGGVGAMVGGSKAAKAAGFQVQAASDGLATTQYALGDAVNATGHARYATMRAEVAALPSISDVASTIVATVKGEERIDFTTPIDAIEVAEDGTLNAEHFCRPDMRLHLTRTSFRQLGATLGFTDGVAYLWDTAPMDVRTMALDRHIALSSRSRPVKLRTMLDGGKRIVYGQVTPRYTAVDTDVIVMAVNEAINGSGLSSCEAEYSQGKGRLAVYGMADTVVDLACGDVFKSGISVEWDDRGTGAIHVRGVAFRNLCLNLIIVDVATIECGRFVHKGDIDGLIEAIKDACSNALDAIAPILDAYGIARGTKVAPVQIDLDDDGVPVMEHGVKAMLTQWATDGTLPLPRRSAEDRDRAVKALMDAWSMEPGDTMADAVNAVTRAAHSTEWIGFDARAEMERLASRLLVEVRHSA